MLFNSFEFLFFLPIVWAVYWLLRNRLLLQNLLIVVASYVFYGWWDWRFLILIAFTSVWSYVVGLLELRRWEAKPSRLLLTISLVVNLVILGVFKYYNFFIGSFNDLLSALHLHLLSTPNLSIILPVGISFYTFQALSYTIDVYRRNIRPTRDPVAFFAFISFFPQLVAGPIERATNLLPQFLREKSFSYPDAVAGCRQMLWGFFKKMVVADNCAVAANFLLTDGASRSGAEILLGIVFFAVQVYGDFSGYSDIAIGVSKLFGVRLQQNFAFPFFSRSFSELWRRWHMSLMGWFRDYLYIPLGGGRAGTAKKVRNVFIVFAVSGLWHGAAWNFVLWGVVTALCFLPSLLLGKRVWQTAVVTADRALPTFSEVGAMLRTFALFLIGMLMFRSTGVACFARWVREICDVAGYRFAAVLPHEARVAGPMIGFMLFVEWLNRREPFGLSRVPPWACLRWILYYFIVCLICFYAPGSQSFVYFQF